MFPAALKFILEVCRATGNGGSGVTRNPSSNLGFWSGVYQRNFADGVPLPSTVTTPACDRGSILIFVLQ